MYSLPRLPTLTKGNSTAQRSTPCHVPVQRCRGPHLACGADVVRGHNAAVARDQAALGHQHQVAGLPYGDGQLPRPVAAGGAVGAGGLPSRQSLVVFNLAAVLTLLLLLPGTTLVPAGKARQMMRSGASR
jgi:hypothetical protein